MLNARALLDAERQAAQARILAIASDFDDIVRASADSNADDEHDPEGSTIAYERAKVAAQLEGARQYLADLEDALERLIDGSYARCGQCGVGIPAERLAARPATRTCVRCAEVSRGRPATDPKWLPWQGTGPPEGQREGSRSKR